MAYNKALRQRKHIEKYYNTQEIGKFPERLKPISKQLNVSHGLHAFKFRDVVITVIATLTADVNGRKAGKRHIGGRQLVAGELCRQDEDDLYRPAL